jgi:hypothetical protein
VNLTDLCIATLFGLLLAVTDPGARAFAWF